VQNDIFAIKLNNLVSIKKSTKDFLHPRIDGRTVNVHPTTKSHLVRAAYKE